MDRDSSLHVNSAGYELTLLRFLARQFPNVDSAMAEIARLSAILTLPKGTVHVISDIHGEDKKLRHVINNASGTLRPLIERLFAGRMEPKQFEEFLTLIFYPAEVTEQLEHTITDPAARREFAVRTLNHQFELIRTLAARYSLKRAMEVFPAEYKELISEISSLYSGGNTSIARFRLYRAASVRISSNWWCSVRTANSRSTTGSLSECSSCSVTSAG